MWRSGRAHEPADLRWPAPRPSIASALPSSSRPPSRGARRRSSRGCCRMNSWTILFWRGLFGGGADRGHDGAAARPRRPARVDPDGKKRLAGRVAFDAGACSRFIPALQLTSVSNVAIIIATGPFLAAALAWVWLREVPHLRTMLASVVALCGVAIILGNARVGSDILGIALAIFMALAIAAMTVMVRRHKDTSMVAAAAISNILGSVVSLPFAHGIDERHRLRPVHSRDVRLLPGRASASRCFSSARASCHPARPP